MYTPFLLGGYAVALLLLLFGLHVIRGSAPELRGARQLNRFILCALGALAFFCTHGWAPAVVTVLGTNGLSFAGAIFVYLATAEVQQVEATLLPWQVGLCAAALPPLTWYTVAHGSPAQRLLLHCLVMAVLFGMAASLLYRRGEAALEGPRQAAPALATTMSAYQIVWGVTGITHPPVADFLHLDTLQTGLSYIALLLACGNVAALMWLSLCVHRRELHQMAQTDSLTGLLNRRAFEEILRHELPQFHQQRRPLGAMLIDIDHFKQINDSLGHRAGDEALRQVSDALRHCTRVSDVLARYGGEEFVVLLRDASLRETECVAERVRESVAALHSLPGGTRLTVSIGVGIRHEGETAEEFLLRCDEAMYGAKRGGRNLVIVSRLAGAEPVVVV